MAQDAAPLGPPAVGPKWMRWDGVCAAAVAAAYILFYEVASHIRDGRIYAVATSTFISLLLAMAVAALAGRALLDRRAFLWNLPLVVILALPVVAVPLLADRFPMWAGWHRLLLATQPYWRAVDTIPGLHGLLQIWLAATLGAAVARVVREVKLLLPMAAVLALVDLYAVFGGGLVAQAVKGKSAHAAHAMQTLTIKMPAPQAPHGAAPIALTVGFADFLFTALFFACFKRFKIRAVCTFWILYAVLVAYTAAVYLTGVPLPALVPIGLVVIVCHWREFRYTRQEQIALAIASGAVALIAAGFWVMSR